MPNKTFVDQMGRTISCSFPPKRIVSLVPSQTELLADLDLNQQVVGITRFCVHPQKWLDTKTIIGGTKSFDLDTIHRLNPDLIIGNKEENYQEGISALEAEYPVWMSDVVTLEDALSMIVSVGDLVDQTLRARQIQHRILAAFESIIKRGGKSVLYLIWRKPWMAAGGETFINTMLNRLGLHNATANRTRYPELTSEEISNLHADYIFLSSEPFPFGEKHIEEIRKISPHSKIHLVNGEFFSWYGSRLAQAPAYFNSLILR